MVAGGVWGFVPGYLRAKWDVNEIIVTLLMTLIGIQLNQYMIQGPLQGTGGYPASETLSPAASLQSFGSTRLHFGVIIALVILLVVYLLLERMTFGFQVSFVGSNPDAARQSGINTKKIIIYTMLLGGVFAGLAGMIQLAAEAGRLQSGLSPDYGFTAVAIALLGMKGPFRVFLASIFFGLLTAGAVSVASTTAVDISIINIIQALIILFILTTSFIEEYKIEINREVL
jgi:simple sugar transport system permease protein